MLERFLQYSELNFKIENKEDFFLYLGGRAFFNGAYRIFSPGEVKRWEQNVADAFPKYDGTFHVFGYDWLGRIFAERKSDGIVLLFEPGTGEVLEIPVLFEEFHNEEIIENSEACIASAFFEEWYKTSAYYKLNLSECVGYKIPLFLNGEDAVDNLEVSDMDVYWTIMAQLIRGVL